MLAQTCEEAMAVRRGTQGLVAVRYRSSVPVVTELLEELLDRLGFDDRPFECRGLAVLILHDLQRCLLVCKHRLDL